MYLDLYEPKDLDGQLSIHESHIEGSLETKVLDRKHKVMDEFVQLTIVLIIKFSATFRMKRNPPFPVVHNFQ